jgi:hypothetical protein
LGSGKVSGPLRPQPANNNNTIASLKTLTIVCSTQNLSDDVITAAAQNFAARGRENGSQKLINKTASHWKSAWILVLQAYNILCVVLEAFGERQEKVYRGR